MNWQLLISLRYLLGKRKEKIISITTFLSIISVTIGVAALIIVLAVMNGFGDKLRQRIVGFNYHVHVEKIGGIKESEAIIDKIKRRDDILSAAPFIDGQAIVLTEGSQPRGVLMRGIDPISEKGSIDIDMVKGKLELGDDELAIGNELAKVLRVSAGDDVSIISGANIAPKSFKIASIFHSGMYEYDANVVFTNINAAKVIFDTKGAVQGIGIRLKNLDIAKNVKTALLSMLGAGYIINTWSELNKNLFAAIRLEKILVFIVVTLTIAVGALNIINTLSLLTMEKTKDIGILKALGATRFNIANIFILKGLMIGLIGSSLGLFFGLLITSYINEIARVISGLTGFEIFSREIYYLDKIPVSMNHFDIGLIIFFAVALSFLATLYPAWRAARLDPIEALRYE